jgi:hypothetical protein
LQLKWTGHIFCKNNPQSDPRVCDNCRLYEEKRKKIPLKTRFEILKEENS